MIKIDLEEIKEKCDNFVKKIFQTDDAHEFKPVLSEIEDAPVSPVGRLTFWIVTAIITFTVLWLIIGKVDIVVSARGIVIPQGEAKIIQPLETGIISAIHIKEGDFVKQGEPLIDIDPATTEPAMEAVKENLANTKLEVERLTAVHTGQNFSPENTDGDANLQRTIFDLDKQVLETQLQIKDNELSAVNDELSSAKAEKLTNEEFLRDSRDRLSRLQKVADIVAKDEIIDAKNKVKTYQTEVFKLGYKISELNSQRIKILREKANIYSDYKMKNAQQISDKMKQMNELQASTDEISFKNTKQTLVAPCDGYIDKLFIHTLGGVVTPAQELIAMTPADMPLLIKATVLNQDIGFVKEGMSVSVKIDTFNFQKYGMIDGRVLTISKNSIQDENLGPVYEIYVEPLTKTLKVEGKDENIRTGMTLTAEVNVGKRRIIEFFIYPLIKYLDEGMSVR